MSIVQGTGGVAYTGQGGLARAWDGGSVRTSNGGVGVSFHNGEVNVGEWSVAVCMQGGRAQGQQASVLVFGYITAQGHLCFVVGRVEPGGLAPGIWYTLDTQHHIVTA